MTVTLDIELLPLLKPIIARLDRYLPVQQQQVIELLVVRYCERWPEESAFIMESIFKHVRQLRAQAQTFREHT